MSGPAVLDNRNKSALEEEPRPCLLPLPVPWMPLRGEETDTPHSLATNQTVPGQGHRLACPPLPPHITPSCPAVHSSMPVQLPLQAQPRCGDAVTRPPSRAQPRPPRWSPYTTVEWGPGEGVEEATKVLWSDGSLRSEGCLGDDRGDSLQERGDTGSPSPQLLPLARLSRAPRTRATTMRATGRRPSEVPTKNRIRQTRSASPATTPERSHALAGGGPGAGRGAAPGPILRPRRLPVRCCAGLGVGEAHPASGQGALGAPVLSGGSLVQATGCLWHSRPHPPVP